MWSKTGFHLCEDPQMSFCIILAVFSRPCKGNFSVHFGYNYFDPVIITAREFIMYSLHLRYFFMSILLLVPNLLIILIIKGIL